jgi:energy-coupling factor transport system ATP-binding protein
MAIEINNLSYIYGRKSPYEKRALNDVTLSISEGERVGIIGATGSGKSTLIQHINGLIKPQSGTVKVLGIDLNVKKPDYKKLRSQVGMLFQYPEYQLFANTVLEDVMFGPLNFGFSKDEAKIAAVCALRLVGLDVDEVKDKSPFELSGGQKRRVAIAGVIAYKPKILILDEPTAGLDPQGKREILSLITELHGGECKTVIIISHNMDEIAEFTDRVVVLKNGEVLNDTTPKKLFLNPNNIENTGLKLPHAAFIASLLNNGGFKIEPPLTKEELSLSILEKLSGGGKRA